MMPISGAGWTVSLTCSKAAPKYFYRNKCHVQSCTLVKRCWPSPSLSHLTHPSLAADDQLGLYHSSHFYIHTHTPLGVTKIAVMSFPIIYNLLFPSQDATTNGRFRRMSHLHFFPFCFLTIMMWLLNLGKC